MNDLVQRAKEFATRAHASIDQRRKYTGDPYIVHPAEVVEIVKTVEHSDDMLAAAWLHDVVEDTPVTIAEIQAEFGETVALFVHGLTDASKPEDGNRAARKAIDREWIAMGYPPEKTIKLADLISNTRSIVEHDPKFAKVYLQEKRLLLEVLKAGDQVLWQQAHDLCEQGLAELGVK